MLSLPFHRRRLRFTTGLTLLVWVLASLASVVNACQWQPHATRAPQSITAQRVGWAAPAVPADAAGHGAEHSFAAACLANLADEASAVAKGESAPTAVAAAVMAFGLDWRLALPEATLALWRSSARPAWPGAALVIRLLRLTI